MSQYGGDELEFRPRRRLRWPIGVVVLMALFAGGLWFAYSSGKGHAPAEVPLLRADDGANKKRPDQPGGMKIPDQDKCIYDPSKCSDRGKGAQTEKLLPPPEAPVARPAPPPPEAATVAPAPEPPPLPAIVQAPAATPTQPAIQPSVQAPPQPAPRQPAPTIASVGKAGGYRLQLASVRSEAAAQQEWDRLKKTQKDLLGGIAAGWSRADLGERGIFYRILAGPIDDPATAERICGELKKRSVGCILVRP
jgi:hypothetical protein